MCVCITTSLFKQEHQLSIKFLLSFSLSYMKMEKRLQKQICIPKTTSASLSMQKNSKTVSKTKPKIRIIHIFAPEIIKTDAANFRELVQRLTGKPTDDQNNNKKPRSSRKKERRIISSNKEMELAMRAGFFGERIKGEEEEAWRGANSEGGFSSGFPEFEGFMQELSQFPFLEGTTQMDVYGETQLA